MDFDKSGLGIGGAGRHSLADEAAELAAMQPVKIEAACKACGDVYPYSYLTCGYCPDCSPKHVGQCDFCKEFFSRRSLANASLGTACPDCYDGASDCY